MGDKIVEPVKDRATVTADFRPLGDMIQGLIVRRLPPVEDERGEIVEIFRESWGFHPDPLVYLYQVSVRPGLVKGWVVHRKQEDRIFISRGVMRWAFFDDRADSATHGLLNHYVFSERNRALFVIPRGVYHAVENIGQAEAVFVNLPTRAYDHADPDKFRLPIKNDRIPFDFSEGRGW